MLLCRFASQMLSVAYACFSCRQLSPAESPALSLHFDTFSRLSHFDYVIVSYYRFFRLLYFFFASSFLFARLFSRLLFIFSLYIFTFSFFSSFLSSEQERISHSRFL